MMPPLLQACDLRRRYGAVCALNGVSLSLERGAAMALVGPSGSGKSTLVRCLAGLEPPDAGGVHFAGKPLGELRGKARRAFHSQVQLVLQDAAQALNPSWTGLSLVREPLDLLARERSTRERDAEALAWMERVDLPLELAQRKPGTMSGGERQRLLLARAMTLQPALLLLDEPLRGLDAPRQAEFLHLLRGLIRDEHAGYLLVTHDLSIALCHAGAIAVMDRGRIVEQATPHDLLARPAHPVTQELLASARRTWSGLHPAADSPAAYINRGGAIPS